MIKKFLKLFIFVLFINISFYNVSFAVHANPNPVEVTQPDGTKIKIRVKGDEFYNWVEDERGYTVIKDTQTKYWTYAQQKIDGSLEKSDLVVGKDLPQGRKNLQDTKRKDVGIKRRKVFEKQMQQTRQFNKKIKQERIQKLQKEKGLLQIQAQQFVLNEVEKRTNFVLLVQFKDLRFKDKKPFGNGSTDTQIKQYFDDLFNKENYNYDGAKGSYYDYFKEVSYGKLEYKSIISPVITVAINHAECGEKQGETGQYKVFELIKTALDQFFTDPNNSALIAQLKEAWKDSKDSSGKMIPQGFTVIHAGGDAAQDGAGHSSDNIWSHKANLLIKYLESEVTYNNILFTDYHTEAAGRGIEGNEGLLRIGTPCHETMHYLDIPDLYDTSYQSLGIGNFCVMASGNYNGDQITPAHPCAWIKYQLGWVNVKTAEKQKLNYVKDAESKENANDAVYKLSGENFDAKEYFLIENRQPKGFDAGLPGASTGKTGLLIYHIDENVLDNPSQKGHEQSVSPGEHYMVAIQEADNRSSNWRSAHIPSSINSGKDTDYYRGGKYATLTVFNDTDTNKPNAVSYDGKYSGIDIFKISESGSIMSFYLGPEPTIYEMFIDSLNDKGVSFINYVMNYLPEKTGDELKKLNLTEQNKIKNYFDFTTDTNMANKVNNMGEVYDSYANNDTVYSILKSSTGVVLPSKAITIMNLNYILNKSGKNITVGNISNGDESPLSNNITTDAIISSHTLVNENMRFTGSDGVTAMTGYKTNYGFLMYKFGKMRTNNSYYIIELNLDTDIPAYITNCVFIPGNIPLPYEKVIDVLDDKGINFINFIMKYSPAKTRDRLKVLDSQERNKIKGFFDFETDANMPNKINDMASLYYTYTESGMVCGIGKEYTGKVSPEQANLIIDLNKVLLQSEQAITSIGNISSENESPLDNETTHSNTIKRFTGVTAIKNIQTYHKNYGTLVYSFDKMFVMNRSYDIMEVTANMDTDDYPNYYWLEGEKKLAFYDLSQIRCCPNPARDGYICIERLPDNLDNFSVEIFTMTAKLVKSFGAKDVIISNINKLKWNCKNRNGENVAPGVYLLLIKNAGQKKVFKIAVIR